MIFSVFLLIGCGGGSSSTTDTNTNTTTPLVNENTTQDDNTTDINVTDINITDENTTDMNLTDGNVTDSNLTDNNNSLPVVLSELTIHHNQFVNSVEAWKIFYSGACTLSLSETQNKETNNSSGSVYVTNRAHTYDGPSLNITSMVEPNKLYIIRGYVKQTVATADNYQVMIKVSSSPIKYLNYNRILVNNTAWNKFRAFVSFTQAEIDAGIELYINSDTNKNNFYLDEVEIALSNYDAMPKNSDAILKIFNGGIVDKDGMSVTIKGVNIIAYDDEDGGTTDLSAKTFMNYSYYNYDKDDFQKIKAMGFNAVRIALWYRFFEDESNPYSYKAEGFAWLDTIVAWAKEAGISVMLDMHAPQGGGFQGPDNITAFWRDSSYRERFKALWVEIAKHYKDDATIVAYDIINEPCPSKQSDYLTLLGETIDGIRAIDSDHIINVENSFSTDNAPFELASHDNILYDFHYYDPWSSFTNNSTTVYGIGGIDATQMRTLFESYSDYYTNKNLAFNVSEFGQKYADFATKNSIEWVSDLIDLILEKNGNYFYFSYKGNEFGIYESKNSFSDNSPKNDILIELLKSK